MTRRQRDGKLEIKPQTSVNGMEENAIFRLETGPKSGEMAWNLKLQRVTCNMTVPARPGRCRRNSSSIRRHALGPELKKLLFVK